MERVLVVEEILIWYFNSNQNMETIRAKKKRKKTKKALDNSACRSYNMVYRLRAPGALIWSFDLKQNIKSKGSKLIYQITKNYGVTLPVRGPKKPLHNVSDLLNQAKAGDKEAWEQLVMNYIPIGARIAGTYIHYHKHLRDEIISAMYYGIVEALKNPEKLYPDYLVSYVCTKIKSAIRDTIRDHHVVKIPRGSNVKYHGYFRIIQRKEDEDNIEYSMPEEICPFSVSDDKSEIEVNDFLNQLTDRQRRIVRLRMKGYTYGEIGKRINISVSRVQQVLSSLKTKVKGEWLCCHGKR